MIAIKINKGYIGDSAFLQFLFNLQLNIRKYTSLQINFVECDFSSESFPKFYSSKQIESFSKENAMKIRSKLKRILIVPEQDSLKFILDVTYEAEFYKFLSFIFDYIKEEPITISAFEDEDEFFLAEDFDLIETIEII